ncbi:TIGR01777 family oxidoreductase [Reinekea sp.]|jgi:uncharacterized protein (TIGR01777 family)|uniref:TIGR01777 family oxidoreductase n=1 Tax=Reinekea sp. TaxID=1970455 RepID=UPI003988CE46
MKFLITGGTGFIGTALCRDLISEGHELTIKTRQASLVTSSYRAVSSFNELASSDEFDIVINLAGEPIADKRWTSSQRMKILNSRIETTRELIDFLKVTVKKPCVLISGSAVGFYGIEPVMGTVDENGSPDHSFASEVCSTWESIALEAEALGIRTCLLRLGVVLGSQGGALKKMLLPFKLGLGGKFGSGQQWMSWVHINDVVGIIKFAIETKNISGPINCTAPNPVTNEYFTKALGKSLNRPTIFNMPSSVLKILFGAMGKELLLEGKQIVPSKLLESGYKFQFSSLDAALAELNQKS